MLLPIPDVGLVHDLPQVGSIVRVVTRWYNNYIFTAKTQPFVDYVYEGTVLPSEKADKPNTFNMTATGIKMRHRTIPMDYVVSIEYLKGKKIETVFRAFKVESGDKTKTYTVIVINDKFECECVGFKYRHKCKHVDAVKKRM
jgi:hypothetical protein